MAFSPHSTNTSDEEFVLIPVRGYFFKWGRVKGEKKISTVSLYLLRQALSLCHLV